MLFAVLLRGEAGELFERAREMTLRRKAEIEGDCRNGLAGIPEELFRLRDFLAHYEIRKVHAGFFFEVCREPAAAAEKVFCDVLHGNRLGEVAAHVV